MFQLGAAVPALTKTDLRPPQVPRRNVSEASEAFEAWKAGETGEPIVDAAMRELAATGRISNRARMITASYLTHDLSGDWRMGAAHFLDALIDADVLVNAGNWQWVAGTGANSGRKRPMNPRRQQSRFDRDGQYVGRWLPAAIPE